MYVEIELSIKKSDLFVIIKLHFLFKEEGFGNSSCRSYIQTSAKFFIFSNSLLQNFLLLIRCCIQCVSCCVLHGAL